MERFKLLFIKACSIIALLNLMAPVTLLSSCSSNDDDETSPAKKGRKLVMIECRCEERPFDSGLNYRLHYRYDELGRLSVISDEDLETGEMSNNIITYDDSSISWNYFGKYHTGYVENSLVKHLNEPRPVDFSYDNKGRLINVSSSYFGLSLSLVWEGNNVTKIYPKRGEIIIKYTKHKGYTLVNQEEFNPICVFGYDLNYYKWHDHLIYYTGLCGYFSEYLPSEMYWTDIPGDYHYNQRSFEYSIDSSGYPTNAIIKVGYYNENTSQTLKLTFKWE